MAESLKEKVTKKLVYDAIKQREKANKKKSDDRKAWREAKKDYDDKKEDVVESIAKVKIDSFKEWTARLDELNQSGSPDEVKKSQENTFKEHENEQIQKQLEGFRPNIISYIEDARKYKPKFGKKLKVAGEESDILALAEQKYSDEVEKLMTLAKLALKQQKLMEQASFDVDSINRNLAEIPLKIEDKIDEVKTILEMLMGKTIAPIVDPESHEFDPDALIGQIKAFLNPVLQLTSPLTALTGKIPVLGDLLQILTMLQQSSSGGSNTLTKEELKKMFPVLPDIPTELFLKLYKTMITVIEFCMTLLMVLINGIFAMLNVVYSKLKIVTSVVPLGNFFPLSLVGAAVKAGPAIKTFLQQFPSQIWDLLMGILKKQFM